MLTFAAATKVKAQRNEALIIALHPAAAATGVVPWAVLTFSRIPTKQRLQHHLRPETR
jgi:hypothetical protein